jgi:hypothetical protein
VTATSPEQATPSLARGGMVVGLLDSPGREPALP